MTLTHLPNSDKTVGELVAERPMRARFFEKRNIDYCCGGRKLLSQVCQETDADLQTLLKALEQFDKENAEKTDESNWLDASIKELIDHIVSRHHEFLKQELPRAQHLAEKVARVHGKDHPELIRVHEAVGALSKDLENHLEKEETVLFPYCITLDNADTLPEIHCGHVSNPIAVMLREHEDAGDLLKEIRTLTQDFSLPEGACNSYRALFETLETLEQDIHEHVHKENNILFPNVLKQVEKLSA